MRRIGPLLVLIACLSTLAALWPGDLLAQRRRPAPAPTPQHRVVRRSAVVFVGGYFYDPFFGPYPWWARHAYPYAYYPIYDNRAIVRVIATPKDAAVYVDGFYAGTVHDFNDWFQGLPLSPGGHEIVLFLDGYQTTRDRVYLAAGSTFKLRHSLEPLRAGEVSERPTLAPPIPPPPDGTFTPPRTQLPPSTPVATEPREAAASGTLALVVQPANAEVAIDGDIWVSSDGRTFIVQVPAGMHRVAITKSGYIKHSTAIEVREGQTARLNVTLTPARTTTSTQR